MILRDWLIYQGTHPWRKVPPSILIHCPWEQSCEISPQTRVSVIFYQRLFVGVIIVVVAQVGYHEDPILVEYK